MKKIAIIVQRYGLEVNGGSELYARLHAEKLSGFYDIEVLTTCALDYTTWENYYPEGLHEVNHVQVRRFAVGKPRNLETFSEINTRLLTNGSGNPQAEQKWIDEQGPYCPQLIRYIDENKDKYDVFIFVTYLYYLTVKAIESVQEKAVLIPTAHDEPYIYFNLFKKVFDCPRAFIFNAEEERALVHKIFKNQNIPEDIVGIGIDIPKDANPTKFRQKYNLREYLLYAGRIDHGKNCPELFDYFAEYKKRNPSDLKLALMGKEIIKVPDHPDIVSLGFVSDEDRSNGMAGAKLFVLPSIYESLSMVVLESMALGVPVVINGKCEVVKGHCLKSNAGLYYNDYYEFEGCINFLLAHDDIYDAMSINAKKYIEKNYRWDVIIDKFRNIIENVGLA